jgi:hypothetical protein
MMDKKKVSVWLTTPDAVKDIEDGNNPWYSIDSEYSEMDTCGWVKIGMLDLDIPRPDADWVRAQFVATLRKEKEKIYGDASEKAMKIEEAIQQLLSIGYDK